jgi:hypothetical protein
VTSPLGTITCFDPTGHHQHSPPAAALSRKDGFVSPSMHRSFCSDLEISVGHSHGMGDDWPSSVACSTGTLNSFR